MSCSSSSTSLPVHTNNSGFLARAIFIFFFLCLVSPSTVCLFTACKLNAHAPSLLLRFWWMEYELQCFWSFSVVFSGSVWTQIFLKRCWGRWRKKRLFRPSGLGLSILISNHIWICNASYVKYLNNIQIFSPFFFFNYIIIYYAVTVTYDSVATDVHPSLVRAIDCPLIISWMFSLVVSQRFTILLVMVPQEGIVYRDSISRMNSLNSSPFEMLTGLTSLQINSVSSFVIASCRAAGRQRDEEGGKNNVILACFNHGLSH